MAFGLWEQDTLIADRFGRDNRPPSPEKRLLMAVLMDALLEFKEVASSSNPDDHARLSKLRAWFHAKDVKWPFSFVNLCEQLDLDPDSIRARLANLSNDQPVRRRQTKQRLR
jgi:hypothetical protein